MKDYQKSLDILTRNHTLSKDQFVESDGLIQELVDKEKPMLVTIDENLVGTCPRCGNTLGCGDHYYDKEYPYCHWCGQKLDWEDKK